MKTTIESIQVGLPTNLGAKDASGSLEQVWYSGFRKLPVSGLVEVSETGLSGDGHADLKNHGGRDKAILCYPAEHYRAWEIELDRERIENGFFAENLTISRGTEKEICVGDVFSIGEDVQMQVSQPRQPCWKLARFADHASLPKMVVETGFCGWYMRVLRTGAIESGMPFELVDRPHPEWSIRRAHRAVYAKKADENFADRMELAALPELSEFLKPELGG